MNKYTYRRSQTKIATNILRECLCTFKVNWAFPVREDDGGELDLLDKAKLLKTLGELVVSGAWPKLIEAVVVVFGCTRVQGPVGYAMKECQCPFRALR